MEKVLIKCTTIKCWLLAEFGSWYLFTITIVNENKWRVIFLEDFRLEFKWICKCVIYAIDNDQYAITIVLHNV